MKNSLPKAKAKEITGKMDEIMKLAKNMVINYFQIDVPEQIEWKMLG